jgi:phosphoribosylaminoimidazole-succinocarboxamide synthase
MIDLDILEQQLDHTLGETHFESFGRRYRGKVRDTYRVDDELILITTDRISAFDHVLRQAIPFKGQVLNQVAAYFFENTRDIAPNHLLAVPDPNVTIAVRCEPVPIEFVVRGYVAGHAWREYRAGRRQISGVLLPDHVKESSRLPTPILTPATKAEEGHDEDISPEEIVKRGILDSDTFDHLKALSLRLFERGTEMASQQGLILADTKYEFGRRPDGTHIVIDEVHTPDSSRYYYSEGYDERLRNDTPQKQLSKEFVREWLMDHGFRGEDGQMLPDLPDGFRVEVARRYIELYEQVTGTPFEPDTHPHPEQRIRDALARFLQRDGT